MGSFFKLSWTMKGATALASTVLVKAKMPPAKRAKKQLSDQSPEPPEKFAPNNNRLYATSVGLKFSPASFDINPM